VAAPKVFVKTADESQFISVPDIADVPLNPGYNFSCVIVESLKTLDVTLVIAIFNIYSNLQNLSFLYF
tara:strand:+ start:23 stop:226 length:204 start_codon:yes stop_codon:yes gene_type:complete